MKFTLPVYDRLIELVKLNPPLYDSSTEEYKDHILHRHIWKKITQEMNIPDMCWKDWKKVWRLKRDEFTRKRREITQQPNALAAKRVRRGPLYDNMKFLVDYITRRRSTSTNNSVTNHIKNEYLSESEDSPRSLGGFVDADALKQEASSFSLPTSRSASPSLSLGMACIASSNSHGSSEKKPSATPKISGIELSNSIHRTCGGDNNDEHALKTSSQHEIKKPLSSYSRISREASDEDDDEISVSFEQASTSYPASDRTTDECIKFDEDHSCSVFTFVSEKMKNFTESTKEWVEDEVLKIYMEAKKRDRMERSNRIPHHYQY